MDDYLKRFLTFSCLTFAGACVVSSSGTFEEVKNKKSLHHHHHHHHHHDHHHDVMTSCSLQWTLWSSPGQQCLLHHPEPQPRSWKPWSVQSGSLLCDELQPFSEMFFCFAIFDYEAIRVVIFQDIAKKLSDEFEAKVIARFPAFRLGWGTEHIVL